MSDISSNDWSQTDASNNQAAPNGAPEGWAPSDVNNTIRAIMGAVKRWRQRANPTATSTGSANAYVLTYSVAPTAYVAGDRYCFISNFSNTAGATTLNVNSLGATAVVRQDGSVLAAGDIPSGSIIEVAYNGTTSKFVLLSTSNNLILATVTTTGNAAVGGTLTVTGTTTLGAAAAASLTLAAPLALTQGGTGSTSASTARTALGSGATGDALFATTTASGARTALGSSTVGDALFVTASAAAGRTTLGLGTSSIVDTGSSGATIPLLNQANTWTGTQTVTGAVTASGIITAASFVGSGAALTGIVTPSSKAQMQAGTDNTTTVTPVRVNDADGACKAHGRCDSSGTLLAGSYNIASCSRTGTGSYTFVFSTAFANTTYTAVASASQPGGYIGAATTKNTGSVVIGVTNSATGGGLDGGVEFVAFGRQ